MSGEAKPDVYVAVMLHGRGDKKFWGDPYVFDSHAGVEKWLTDGWCSDRVGYKMEILKHVDWHGAGLIKLTKEDHIFEHCREVLVRVYQRDIVKSA
jgi:hypothetical protein